MAEGRGLADGRFLLGVTELGGLAAVEACVGSGSDFGVLLLVRLPGRALVRLFLPAGLPEAREDLSLDVGGGGALAAFFEPAGTALFPRTARQAYARSGPIVGAMLERFCTPQD